MNTPATLAPRVWRLPRGKWRVDQNAIASGHEQLAATVGRVRVIAGA
jgi:hypothetical protein